MQFLEQTWGQVGWELQTARSIADIRNAFADWTPETRAYSKLDFLASVCSEPRAPSEVLRRFRQQVAENGNAQRNGYEIERTSREAVERASAALNQCGPGDPKVEFEKELARRQQRLNEASTRIAKLREEHDQLRDALAEAEANFGQHELLDFVRSGRYSFRPLNVANAVAGLPHMSWRQSFKRCARIECRCCNTPAYETFKIIKSAASSRGSSLQLADIVRTSITKLRKQTYEIIELKKNWYYLRKAIETVQQRPCHPRALPYRISAEYQSKIQRPSAIDCMLQEEEQLS